MTNTNDDAKRGTVGATVGAVGAGIAGGAVGAAVGGPIGAVAGAAAGAAAGGMAGKTIGESFNPATEEKYWRENYVSRPYADARQSYDEYAPAYRYGWERYEPKTASGRTFESFENDFEQGWEKVKGKSKLEWQQAKHAVRDAWNRMRDRVDNATTRDGT